MKKFILSLIICVGLISTTRAQQVECFIGEVRLFAGNFPPSGWAFCEGQLLPISNYTALFSILGTMYGGNGVNNFALPDLRGTLPMHPNNGGKAGIPVTVQGENFGYPYVPLTQVLVKPADSTKIPVNTLQGSSLSLYPPTLGMRYIIALNGIYPSRS